MNARVLELLKNPGNIQAEHLQMLKDEIKHYPYLQSVRALHLYGVNLFEKENYQSELSATAAYTTHKKNLYQLINGKIDVQPKEVSVKIAENEMKQSIPEDLAKTNQSPESLDGKANVYIEVQPPEIRTNRQISVNGERNRILFEGEENFLNEENSAKIDIESTLESGNLVINTPEKFTEIKDKKPLETGTEEKAVQEIFAQSEIKVSLENDSEKTSDIVAEKEAISFQEIGNFEAEKEYRVAETEKKSLKKGEVGDFTPETIISEDKNEAEKVMADDSRLSFHGTESFLPEVKIEPANSIEPEKTIKPVHSGNKYEDEIRKLIAEVEEKMKQNKKEVKKASEESEILANSEISFSETQSFDEMYKKEENSDTENNLQKGSIEKKTHIQLQSEAQNVETQEKSQWKPMSLETYTPDSVIKNIQSSKVNPGTEISDFAKKTEKEDEIISAEKNDIDVGSVNYQSHTSEKHLPSEGDTDEVSADNDSALNVSFFGNGISTFSKPEEKEIIPEGKTEIKNSEEKNETGTTADSNIPGFINTWQNWLKIERSTSAGEAKIETKAKVIDAFIENNPKITQLKDDSEYVVKERNKDITHLMTETLARLYTEQKLYSKAINAYHVLSDKHPDRKDYFEEKIKEIKEIKGRG